MGYIDAATEAAAAADLRAMSTANINITDSMDREKSRLTIVVNVLALITE